MGHFADFFFGEVDIEIRQSGQGSCLHLQKQTLSYNMIQSIKRFSVMSPFPLVPRAPLGPLMFPSC